jgi:hypothetical protein
MAPPPPYTREQLDALTSPTEKIRAMAELKSMWEYTSGMEKKLKIREQATLRG